MPHISPRLHSALRDAVAAQFGQPLRYPSHCDALEAELQKAAHTAGRRLSPSTLRRFFGLVDKEGGYHLHTLDTLARYAGHADFATFGQAVSSLALAGSIEPATPTDIPELLAMQTLARPERLLLGYFLGRIARPTHPQGPASALSLRLAAHPAGQEFFVESFVDLAHLNGAYGEVLVEYLRHKHTAEAQLFGNCVLFLGEFLAENETAWRRRLQHLLALPVPAEVHAFPRGRRAFAQIVAAWYDAPAEPVAAGLLAQFRLEAASLPRSSAPSPPLPAFYNHFPAGYHFHIAEALFLTGQFGPLLEWVEYTRSEFPELAQLEQNVYNELLRAFHAAAEFRTGRAPSGAVSIHSLFQLETHSWLLDYYQVHTWLVELNLAAGPKAPEVAQLQKEVDDFAELHRMPFFRRAAQNIAANWS